MNQRRYRDRNSEKINKAVAEIFKALDGLTYWDADCALSRVAESLKDFTFVSSLAATEKDDNHSIIARGFKMTKVNTIESYGLLLHEIYFDDPPKITVEGELDTFGSPYSDEDTSDVVF